MVATFGIPLCHRLPSIVLTLSKWQASPKGHSCFHHQGKGTHCFALFRNAFPQPLLLLHSSTHHLGPKAKALTLTLSICRSRLAVISPGQSAASRNTRGFSFPSSQRQYLQFVSSIHSFKTEIVTEHIICARPPALGQTQRKAVQVLSAPWKEGTSTQLQG